MERNSFNIEGIKNILNSILGAPRGIYDTVQNRAKQGMQTSPLTFWARWVWDM